MNKNIYFFILVVGLAIGCDEPSLEISKKETKLAKEQNLTADNPTPLSESQTTPVLEPLIDLSRVPIVAELDSKVLSALFAAEKAFNDDSSIPPEKKNFENYHVIAQMTPKRIYVVFSPNAQENDPYPLGGENSVGKETTFIVDRATSKVLRRYFSE